MNFYQVTINVQLSLLLLLIFPFPHFPQTNKEHAYNGTKIIISYEFELCLNNLGLFLSISNDLFLIKVENSDQNESYSYSLTPQEISSLLMSFFNSQILY